MSALTSNALALEYYRKLLLDYDIKRELEKEAQVAKQLKIISALVEPESSDVVMNDQPVEVAKIDYLVAGIEVDSSNINAALTKSAQRETKSLLVQPKAKVSTYPAEFDLSKLDNPGQVNELERLISRLFRAKIDDDFKNTVSRFITQAHQFDLTDDSGAVIKADNFKHFDNKAFFATDHNYKILGSDLTTVTTVTFSNLLGFDSQNSARRPMLAVAEGAKILRYFYHPFKAAMNPTELSSSTISSPVAYSGDLTLMLTQNERTDIVLSKAHLTGVYRSFYKPMSEEKCVRSDKAVTAENIQELFDHLYEMPNPENGRHLEQEVGLLFVNQQDMSVIRALIRNVDIQKPNSIEFKLEKLYNEGKIFSY